MTTSSYLRIFALTLIVILTLGACGGSTATTEATVAVDSPLAVAADTVWGPFNVPEDQRGGQVCVLGSRFPRNSEIVWRARVFDPDTEAELDDASASVEVRLADGQVFEMRYGAHPRENPTDFFWTASFDIPIDYPSGTLNYEIVATSTDNRVGTFAPFNVAPSLLTVTEDVLETIPEG
ncbi:MAG: hypothetical protein JJE47_12975 [Acidimicrobiia bacterium]|nr:hypothetical protein [Acidimicrobiia bacterium]